MAKIITYNLSENGNSNYFYNRLSNYTSDLALKGKTFFREFLTSYKEFIVKSKSETLRSDEEYLFELILTGILWRNYSFNAVQSELFATFLLHKMYKLRRKYKSVKKQVDYLRGVLGTSLLVHSEKDQFLPEFNLRSLRKLLRWLAATGEFREEVYRLERLFAYLETLPSDTSNDYLIQILTFANLFIESSQEEFGEYTEDVDSFIKTRLESYKWKEDYIFCGRRRNEYHLNIVGSELMNIAFYKNFHKTEKKALLLPACMSILQTDKCKATNAGLDKVCNECSPGCSVYQYKKLGDELGFTVHIIPHSSDFSKWLGEFAAGKNIGVIGVACILNLIQGGLELKALDIPAQCVFLDYCGCSTHWDADGFPTSLNKDKLIEILGIN